MELNEFVRDVLVQISQGVRNADAEVTKAGGVASPAARHGPASAGCETHFATLENGAPVFLVDFDVAVSVSEATEAGARAALRIASIFSAGAGGKNEETTATVSRVRFKVPLALPVNAASSEKVADAKRRQEEAVRRANLGGGSEWRG